MSGRSGRFLLAASAVGVAAGAVALAATEAAGGSGPWALAGWGPMAGIGLGSGGAMAARHGRPGSGFLAALVAGMLSRLTVAAALGLVATRAGEPALLSYVAGLAAGFLPLQAFEVVWFYRAARAARPSGGEAR